MATTMPQSGDTRAGRRRHSRLRVCLPARLITLDGTLPATLLDLSVRGARLGIAAPELRPGAQAVLTWAGFEAFCAVAWTRGAQCGLDFELPLQPGVLIATRALVDSTPRVDAIRVAARDWAIGLINR